MHRLYLLVFAIGLTFNSLAYAEDEDEAESAAKRGMVLVEPALVSTADAYGEVSLAPYEQRRGHWGALASLGFSSYTPTNYVPNFVNANFADVYGNAQMPMLEIELIMKRNLSVGSLGLELAYGMYKNESKNLDFGDSTLQVMHARVGAGYFFDAYRTNPILVPYVVGGLYTGIFRESLGGNALNGNTQIAPYVHAGVAFQLDWMDKTAARISYFDSGILASFIYVEGQQYVASGNAKDSNLGSGVNYAAGIRIEF